MSYSLWLMLTQFLHVCVLGVSLTDDEADNNQGSRYCLVAIGRLQVCLVCRCTSVFCAEANYSDKIIFNQSCKFIID